MHFRRSLVFALAAALIGSPVLIGAQNTTGTRPKPFAAFNESAQRLKDSLAARLGAVSHAPVAAVVGEGFAEESLADLARGQIGLRYVLGAQAPGRAFDCSGLVRFVMAALRIDLPRTANEQARRGLEIPKDFDQMKTGDLITFSEGKRITHIGIYVGDGRFVHASVTARRVIESSLNEPGSWYARHWAGVRRVVATSGSSLLGALP